MFRLIAAITWFAKPSGGDPNQWCDKTCADCSSPCSGNKGHNGPHKCFTHS